MCVLCCLNESTPKNALDQHSSPEPYLSNPNQPSIYWPVFGMLTANHPIVLNAISGVCIILRLDTLARTHTYTHIHPRTLTHTPTHSHTHTLSHTLAHPYSHTPPIPSDEARLHLPDRCDDDDPPGLHRVWAPQTFLSQKSSA